MKLENGYRLCLHKIYSCGLSYYHPHNWESACLILEGSYLMKLGSKDEIYTEILIGPGYSYEMIKPFIWHSVNPIFYPVYSIMMIGNKFKNFESQPRSPFEGENPSLFLEEKTDLLNRFRALISKNS